MNPTELLDVNMHRFAREASPDDLVRVLRVLAVQMERRHLAGFELVKRGASLLDEVIHHSAAADAIARAFRHRDGRRG